MASPFAGRVLPPQQRKTLAELSDGIDLSSGDTASKRSAFWTMLVLSGVIATAGVVADSTATVIGAMIIAPLATPIMGLALGIVKGSGRMVRGSALFVLGGVVVVVGIGALTALLIPDTTDLLANSQISGRTSPTLTDLVAAIATGLAGAVGLSRRDVADIMPGVAIAISLVPPLAVVGICLGQGALGLSLGAFVLFASNLVAMVIAGSIVFTAAGYAADTDRAFGFPSRRAYLGVAVGLVLVLIPLAANTLANILVVVWTHRATVAADAWVSGTTGASVDSVTAESLTIYVDVRSPTPLPPYDDLLAALEEQLPNGITVVVRETDGETVEIGRTGSA